MSKELCYVIDQISREKGISRDALIEVLESALFSAVRKRYGNRTNISLKIDPKTCEIRVFETRNIVESVANPEEEIALSDVLKRFPDKSVGDTIETPIALNDFGRIAAQTAKQVIFQKVREAERDIIFDEYKDKTGQIVGGTVIRKEKGFYYIHIGKTEALLPQRDALPNENIKRGDSIKAFLVEVRQTPRGPAIILSRTDPDFVVGLFRMEVPEIHDGIVHIRGIAREPGERTKIAVYSKDPSVDPVGACVGMKGTRVQSIVRELRGERIDIIPWHEDPRVFITRALTPAAVDRIGISEEGRTAMVIADDQQLSLAIGKRGQNVKLAAKLTGWDIEVMSETEYSQIRMEEAEKNLSNALRKEIKNQKTEDA